MFSFVINFQIGTYSPVIPLGHLKAERGMRDVVQTFNLNTGTFFYIFCENLDEMLDLISM